jgi:PAT family acetyl-CoA transporter-like MFS transporter 1
LKLIEYGVPKDKIAQLAIPLVPVQIVLPFLISRYTAGPKPMLFYIKAFPVRLFMTVIFALWVYYTPRMMVNNEFPFYYYIAIVAIYMVYQVPFRSMYVADMSFFAKISDPLVGGTYMTLMNTISNLGGSWVQSFFLWLVDKITWRSCLFSEDALSHNSTLLPLDNKCETKVAKELCAASGGKCHIDIDGYYIEICINVVYGIIWFYFGRKLIIHLQNLPTKDWYLLTKTTSTKKNDEGEIIPLKSA